MIANDYKEKDIKYYIKCKKGLIAFQNSLREAISFANRNTKPDEKGVCILDKNKKLIVKRLLDNEVKNSFLTSEKNEEQIIQDSQCFTWIYVTTPEKAK